MELKKLVSLLSRDQRADSCKSVNMNSISLKSLVDNYNSGDNIMHMKYVDKFSDCGATTASTVNTIAFGKSYSCRYRDERIKRVILHIPVRINFFTFQGLVDTGATISAIKPILLLQVLRSVHRRRSITPFTISLSVEEPNKYTVNEFVELLVNIENRNMLWRFFVVPNLSSSIVLGMDWLMAYKVELNCGKQELKIGVPNDPERATGNNSSNEFHVGEPMKSIEKVKSWSDQAQLKPKCDSDSVRGREKIYTGSSSSRECEPEPDSSSSQRKAEDSRSSQKERDASIRICEGIQINPKTCKRVQIFSMLEHTGDVFITPRKKLEYDRKIAIGKSIIHLKKGIGDIYLTNLSNKVIRLPRKTNLGEYEMFNDDDILCNLDEVELYNRAARNVVQSRLKDEIPTEEEFKSLTDVGVSKKLLKKLKFGKNLTERECERLKTIISCYADIFNTDDYHSMMTHRRWYSRKD